MTQRTEQLDLGPATRTVTDLLDRVDEGGLAAPTPCESCDVRGLLNHFLDLTRAFRDAARKDLGPMTDTPPPDPSRHSRELGTDWRARLSQQLGDLAEAWRDPAAWEGETRAGGVALPAAVAGQVALNEVVLHGWDLARAVGAPYEVDEASLRASIALTSATTDPAERDGMFGPVVPAPEDAPLLNRAVAMAGRNPDWSP